MEIFLVPFYMKCYIGPIEHWARMGVRQGNKNLTNNVPNLHSIKTTSQQD